jgi:hypothetical protein
MAGPGNQTFAYTNTAQRLGNKTLFSSSVPSVNGTKRYFSGLDAEIYFGNTYIDETVQIAFTVQQSTLPLFGYNSYIFDAVAQGSRIINGQFVVNFTKASYLYEVLNTLADIDSNNNMTVTTTKENSSSEQNKTTNKPRQLEITKKAPMWNKSFNIVCSYGDAREISSVNSTMLQLDNVVITGCSQQYGIDGEPIYETYTFIARDIEFLPLLSEQSTATQNYHEDKDALTIHEAVYSEYIDDSTRHPFGLIMLRYDVSLAVEDILMEPKIELTGDYGLRTITGQKVSYQTAVSYKVSDSWRQSIKQYCISDPNNVPSTFPADFVFKFKVNGSTSTKSVTLDVRLGDIYSSM